MMKADPEKAVEPMILGPAGEGKEPGPGSWGAAGGSWAGRPRPQRSVGSGVSNGEPKLSMESERRSICQGGLAVKEF